MFDEYRELTELGMYNVFVREFLPQSRNIGISIEEIKHPDGFMRAVVVTTSNNKQEETIYWLLLLSDESWGVEGHVWDSWFN